MTAIISTTYDSNYLFYLPITTWAWNQLGVDVICCAPHYSSSSLSLNIFDLLTESMWGMGYQMCYFNAPEDKQATYAQCSRLYAAALPLFEDNEILITSDIDMAVLSKDLLEAIKPELVTIVGSDLVPEGQFPMCYIAMKADKWRKVMNIMLGESVQNKLDQLLGDIECENFRGNYWAKDQEEAYNHITKSSQMLYKATRSNGYNQFATRRADRDGWPELILPDQYIDAHLPRPGYTPENFAKIMNLFRAIYPTEDFTWMQEYRDEYVKLINQ